MATNNLRREVINTRPSFLAKKPSSWRANGAVLLVLLGCLQFAIYLCHLIWLGERWLTAFFWSL